MTRIIAGAVGSLRLKGPAKATRPTSDRVKESIFSILESLDVIEGAVVVDLFAGTGALGLEAASRGAKSVTLVEEDRAAVQICRDNLDLVIAALQRAGIEASCTIKHQSAERYLKSDHNADLIFIDPPYEYTNAVIVKLFEHISSTHPAFIVLERSGREKAPEISNRFSFLREVTYGDTVAYFLTTGGAR